MESFGMIPPFAGQPLGLTNSSPSLYFFQSPEASLEKN